MSLSRLAYSALSSSAEGGVFRRRLREASSITSAIVNARFDFWSLLRSEANRDARNRSHKHVT